jgi:hypothetical protein
MLMYQQAVLRIRIWGPDPDPQNCRYTYGPKRETTEMLKASMAFTLTKKVEIG